LAEILEPLRLLPGLRQPRTGFLKSLGAEIVLNPRVHAKLYIREPGLSGGLQTAIVGSENLTVPKYAELGLKIINDGVMIDRLRGVFFDIYAGQSY